MLLPASTDLTKYKEEWDRIVRLYIQDDETMQVPMHTIWNKVDARLTGQDVPAGFSTLYSQDYATAEKADALKTRAKLFVPINRAHSMRESVLGGFITGKKTLTATGRTYHDRQLAQVIGQFIQFVLDESMFNDSIFVPTVDRAISKGLDWITAEFDPYLNNYEGGIIIRRINCRDILLDSHGTSGSFFSKDRRRTERYKLDAEEANRKFKKKYGDFYREANTDIDYDIPYDTPMDAQKSTTATFYKMQLMVPVPCTIFLNEHNEIDTLPSNEAGDIEQNRIVGEDEKDFVYIVHFNKIGGVFHIERSPYSTLTYIPMANVESDSRRYPFGDIELYENLLDLISTVATALVENAKRANRGIAQMDKDAWLDKELVAAVQSAVNHGGVAPGMTNLHFSSQATNVMTGLITLAQGWLADLGSQHPASQGQLPAKQIAENTVEMLIAQDKTSHGRKDVMVRLALTQLARLIHELTREHVTEPMFIRVTDAPANSPEYIPINKTMTEAEYHDMILRINELDMPEMMPGMLEEQFAQLQQEFQIKFIEAKKEFEKNNDVKQRIEDGFEIDGELHTDDHLAEMLAESHLGTDEFRIKYDPKPAQVPIYDINILSNVNSLNLRFEIDNDFETDKQFVSNRALTLRKMGEISRIDMLQMMGMTDPKGLSDRLNKEMTTAEAIMLAKEIVADPEMFNAVKSIVQSTHQPDAQPSKTE